MLKVLVVGLGEIGTPIYEIIKESGRYDTYGLDLVKKLEQSTIPNEIDVLHICIPCKDDVQFCQVVLEYLCKYKPELLIIHSTVTPHTTSTIAKYTECLVVHSPIRGMHKTMKRDIKRYTKYIGPMSEEAGKAAKEHFEEMGLRTKVLSKAVETELGKIFETSYTAMQIAVWQEMHRIALSFGADIDQVAELIDDTSCRKYVQIGPVWFPNVIGGHCLMPNIKLLLSVYDSKIFEGVLESNEKRKREVNDEKVLDGIRMLRRRFNKNRKRVRDGKVYES